MVTLSDILKVLKEGDFEIHLDKLDANESLIEQGLDSLDFASILFELEDKYAVPFSNEAIKENKISSLNDILSFINKDQIDVD